MCALQGIEPLAREMPIGLEDFPDIVRTSLDIFNRLPDRLITTELGPLYTGKDMTSIPVFFEYADITLQKDKKLVIEIVQHLDQKAVKREVQKHKRAADKIKHQNRGSK